jgi:DNA-binding MarR family transcriptional regulator
LDAKTHKIATMLTDGRPHRPSELARDAGAAITMVPTVIKRLRDSGYSISARRGVDRRSVIYQLAGTARSDTT